MSLLYAFVAAGLFGCGLYMVLSRQLVRLLLGLSLVTNAVNLVIFQAGRIRAFAPPLIPQGAERLTDESEGFETRLWTVRDPASGRIKSGDMPAEIVAAFGGPGSDPSPRPSS